MFKPGPEVDLRKDSKKRTMAKAFSEAVKANAKPKACRCGPR
jgi:hypothetical protein